MLASISPVGEASRQQRWPVTATAYTLGSTAGGALIGAALGGTGALLVTLVPALGRALSPGRLLVALGALLLVGAAVDADWVPLRLAGWQRQVDERWLTSYRGWVYGAGFGLQLGAGVLTIVSTTATYAMLLTALLSAEVATGTVIGATFGLVRAVPLLTTRSVRTPEQLRRLHVRIERVTAAVSRVTVVALVFLGGAALGLGAAALTGRLPEGWT